MLHKAHGFESNIISEYREFEVEWGFVMFFGAVLREAIGPFDAGTELNTVTFDFSSDGEIMFFDKESEDPAYRCPMKAVVAQ